MKSLRGNEESTVLMTDQNMTTKFLVVGEACEAIT